MKTKTEVRPQHTPTPWKVVNEDGIPGWTIRTADERHYVATVPDTNISESKATADFIVRAVNCHEELLQNLKNAYTALCVLSSEKETKMLNEIDEAIAKAEGR